MKIFILVLVFSLLDKFHCKDAELKAILTDKVNTLLRNPENKDTHLKDIIKDKLIPLLQKVLENKDTHLKDIITDKDIHLKDVIKDKLKPLLKDPKKKDTHLKDTITDKDIHLKDIIKDKLKPLLQEDKENKQDTHLKDIIKDKLNPLLQEDPENKKLNHFGGAESDQEKGIVHLFPDGDVADLFGNNQHYKIPDNYQDFGRRFILQYPYTEKKNVDELAENDLHNTVKKFVENKQNSQEPLLIKAPPEFVIDIAKRSILLNQSKPKNPTDDIIHKNILRSGNYWNDVQKEEIDPKKILRSIKSENSLESVRVEIKPGSKLYNLISILKAKSPRLIYVINKDFE